MSDDLSTPLPGSLGATSSIQLFRLLVVLGNHVRTRMDARLASTGLTTQQATALTIVGHHDPAPTLGAIARAMGCSHQNVRQIVSALERKALVTVEVDPLDRRARRVRSTPAVAEAFEPRDDDDHAAVAEWFAPLSDDEQAIAVALLGRVQRHLAGGGAPGS